MGHWSTAPESPTPKEWCDILRTSLLEASTVAAFYRLPTEREQIRFSYSQTESNETILQTAVEIILTEPEHRPGLLVRINPSITKDGLEQIGRATREWLDHNARYRIRAIARRCFEGDSDPRFIAPEWTTTGEIERMLALLAETEFPDTTLAVSYAMAQAHDAAYTCTTLTLTPST